MPTLSSAHRNTKSPWGPKSTAEALTASGRTSPTALIPGLRRKLRPPTRGLPAPSLLPVDPTCPVDGPVPQVGCPHAGEPSTHTGFGSEAQGSRLRPLCLPGLSPLGASVEVAAPAITAPRRHNEEVAVIKSVPDPHPPAS